MAVDDINGRRRGKRKESRVYKHQVQSGCREGAGWRQTGQPNLTRETNFSGTNVGKKSSQLTTIIIGNLTRLVHTLL